MSELELALDRLGRELDYPGTPDLTGAVRRRLTESRRPAAWRRPLVIALAALLVVVGALMAVPQSRSAILDWLGIGAATVRFVDELPKTDKTREELALGERMSLEQARELSDYTIRVPTLGGLDDPDVYRGHVGQVSFLYGSEDEPRLLITHFLGTGTFEKLLSTETDVEVVTEDDAQGAWLEGQEHILFFPTAGAEAPRLVGNTLLLQRDDGVTVRIEGDITKRQALRIYHSMR
jgi:hypothetical protein